MSPLLLLALVVGAVLPPLIGVAIVVLGTPKGGAGSWAPARAFAKGLALGALIGLAVSGVTVALILGGAWLRQR